MQSMIFKALTYMAETLNTERAITAIHTNDIYMYHHNYTLYVLLNVNTDTGINIADFLQSLFLIDNVKF